MKKSLLCLLAASCLLLAAPRKPKLVVAIVIDQFRYDYLTRFRGEYRAGFDRLLTRERSSPTRSTSTFPPSPPSATAPS